MSSMTEPRGAPAGHRPQRKGSASGRADIEASLPSGVRVQVWNRFDGAWASGFQVFATHANGGYLVRRLSDRSLLPMTFAETDLRLDPVPLAAAGPNSTPPAVA